MFIFLCYYFTEMYFVNAFMKKLEKISTWLILLSIWCFCAVTLNAAYFQQNKGNSLIPDSTKIEASNLQDTVKSKKKSSAKLIKSVSLINMNSHVFLDKNKFETTDYRTTADFFRNIPFGFVRDLGSVGQPNEVLVYGHGFGNATFLSDGVSITNRLSNSLDLNFLQTESIDSIEIISPAKGFLFGGFNNPVAVNFISREPHTLKPYSRLRFYQAANAEGMIDGIFSLYPANNLNTIIEITNQSINPIYSNPSNIYEKIGTDHSNWSASIRIRYLLSEKINILLKYTYFSTNTQLFGGIDADSIRRTFAQNQFDEILYDNIRAPVKYLNRYQKVNGNNFNLRLLGTLLGDFQTDLTFYYQSYLSEFRQNDFSETLQQSKPYISNNNESSTLGINLKQNFNSGLLNFVSITNLEKNIYDSPLLSQKTYKSLFSTAGIFSSSFLNDSFTPSIFFKYLNYSNVGHIGIGADLIFQLTDNLMLYGGYSFFEKPRTVWEERFVVPNLTLDKQKISVLELSASIKNNLINLRFGYFSQNSSNVLLSTNYTDFYSFNQTSFFTLKDLTLQGLNVILDMKAWKIIMNTNSSFYFSSQDRKDYKLPNYSVYGGIYYIDTLFNKNLKLKTGLNYSSIGKRNFVAIDFEKNISSAYTLNPFAFSDIINPDANSTIQFDFYFAGKIQDKATIYLVYENIFNSKYFIVPYYPKQSRGLRLGVTWEFLD